MQALAPGVLRKLEHLARFAVPAPRDVAQRDDRALLDRQRRDGALDRAASALAAPDVVRQRAPVARVRAPVPREGVAAAPKALGVDGGRRRPRAPPAPPGGAGPPPPPPE